MRWLAEPSGKRGRCKLFSDAAIEFCLSIKCLFNQRLGERVMARTFERQVVELHIRLALLNRFGQLERPQTVVAAAVA